MEGQADFATYATLYGEYGLTPRLTFGGSLGADQDSSQAIGFLRYTFTPDSAPLQFAVDFGGGVRNTDWDGETPLLRIGASAGYGFGPAEAAWIPIFEPSGGWASLDGIVMVSPDGDTTIWQVEGSLGLNLTTDYAALVDLKVEDWPETDVIVTASPSLLAHIDGLGTVQIGLRLGLAGSDDIGLRLGLWRDF